MTEHVHGWEWDSVTYAYRCATVKCNKLMSVYEAMPLLNATERLSAEDANNAAMLIKSEYETKKWSTRRDGAYSNFNSLQAYANILEGKE